MPTRNAEATWRGNLKEGSGDLAVGSGAFEGPYSFMSRFEDGDATNPEELIGAAHAGCFAMALGNALDENGFEADELHVEAEVHLDPEALEIDWIQLTLEGKVPDIDEETFLEIANEAKAGCPVSKVLAGAEIRLDASLV